MRKAILTILLSVLVAVPWVSAQTAGPTVSPAAPTTSGGEVTKTARVKSTHGARVTKRRHHVRHGARKKPALKPGKKSHARHAPGARSVTAASFQI